MGFINYVLHVYKKTYCPVKYYRSLGMNIGERCEIYPTVSFGSEPYLIHIGDHVRITDNVQFITHDGGAWVIREIKEELSNADKFGKIEIGNNVHIGSNSILMPGIHIGSNCIIGSGAVVTHDIPDNSVAVGVPARVIETIEDYYLKNKDLFDCTKTMAREEKRKYLQEKYGGRND